MLALTDNARFKRMLEEAREEYIENMIRWMESGAIHPELVLIEDVTKIPPALLKRIIRAKERGLQLWKEREKVAKELSVEDAAREANRAIKKYAATGRAEKRSEKEKYEALKSLHDFIFAVYKRGKNPDYDWFTKCLRYWWKLAYNSGFGDYADIAHALKTAAELAKDGDSVDLSEMKNIYGSLLPYLTTGVLSHPWSPFIATSIYNTMVTFSKSKRRAPSVLAKQILKTYFTSPNLLKQRGRQPSETISITGLEQLQPVTLMEAAEIVLSMVTLWLLKLTGKLTSGTDFLPGVLLYGPRGVGKTTVVEAIKQRGLDILQIQAPVFSISDLFLPLKVDVNVDDIAKDIISFANEIQQSLSQLRITDVDSAKQSLANTLNEVLEAKGGAEALGVNVENIIGRLQTFLEFTVMDVPKIVEGLQESDEASAVEIVKSRLINLAADFTVLRDDNKRAFITTYNDWWVLAPLPYLEGQQVANSRTWYNIIVKLHALINRISVLRAFRSGVRIEYEPISAFAEHEEKPLIVFIDGVGYNPELLQGFLTFMTGGVLGTKRFKSTFVIAASNLPHEGQVRPLSLPAMARFLVLYIKPSASELQAFVGIEVLLDPVLNSLLAQAKLITDTIRKHLEVQARPQPTAEISGITEIPDVTVRVTIGDLSKDYNLVELEKMVNSYVNLVRVYLTDIEENESILASAVEIKGFCERLRNALQTLYDIARTVADAKIDKGLLKQYAPTAYAILQRYKEDGYIWWEFTLKVSQESLERIGERIITRAQDYPLHHLVMHSANFFTNILRGIVGELPYSKMVTSLIEGINEFYDVASEVITGNVEVQNMSVASVVEGVPTMFSVTANPRAFSASPLVLAGLFSLLSGYAIRESAREKRVTYSHIPPEYLVGAQDISSAEAVLRERLDRFNSMLEAALSGLVGNNLAQLILMRFRDAIRSIPIQRWTETLSSIHQSMATLGGLVAETRTAVEVE